MQGAEHAIVIMKRDIFHSPQRDTAPATISHVARDDAGDFVLDAPLMAALFGHSVEELRQLTGRGLVSGTVESGSGEDEGTWRLTLRCGNRMWQAIAAADGTIRQQQHGFTSTSPQPAQRSCGHGETR